MKHAPRVWNVLVTTHAVKIAGGKKMQMQIVNEVLADAAFAGLPSMLSDVSVVFLGDKEIRALNKKYRNKDKATDVLSFPQYDKFVKKPLSPVLGDLVISVPTAKRQAVEFEVTEKEELLRLVVHGLLHLAGYDHEGVSRNEAERMRRAERRLYRKFREKYYG